MSRFAVLQPIRPTALAERLASRDGTPGADYVARLQVQSERYDPGLQERFLAEYVAHLCGLLQQAGEAGADLVLLPECCLPVGGCYTAAREHLLANCPAAEALWLERTAPLARQYEMLIASCYYRREGERLYNDAVLMDERGEVAGIYHKVHLPCPLDWEATEAGLFTAGTEHPVFPTRVGRLGFQICYDIDFPEGSTCLALNGAEVILHPTVGYAFPDEEETVAEGRLRTRATDNSVVLLYANFGPTPGRSAIYDKNGNQVACCGRGDDRLVFADLDAQAPRMQNWGVAVHDHRAQLCRKRRPDTYGPLVAPEGAYLSTVKPAEGPRYEYPDEVGLN